LITPFSFSDTLIAEHYAIFLERFRPPAIRFSHATPFHYLMPFRSPAPPAAPRRLPPSGNERFRHSRACAIRQRAQTRATLPHFRSAFADLRRCPLPDRFSMSAQMTFSSPITPRFPITPITAFCRLHFARFACRRAPDIIIDY